MSENQSRTIPFVTEDGAEIYFEVLEQTTIAGVNYILVTEVDDDAEEAQAYIMKEIPSEAGQDTSVFEFVEEDQELDGISRVFEELLEDTDIIKQK